MLTYDRRASAPLLQALGGDGFASSLVEYGRGGQYALDLQLRGYAGKPNHWATLYVGLTKVLDLHFHSARGFRLDAHPTWKVHGWDPSWETYTPTGLRPDQWREVENYLERAIPAVGPRFLKEGAVQSAISAFRTRNLTVVDREVAISFSSQQERKQVSSRLAQPVLAALNPPGNAGWWKAQPSSLGGECDALAVANDGSLLAIEIKPAKALGTIPWAPLQVRHYANLIREWMIGCPDAATIINGMVEQRAQLGLTAHAGPVIAVPTRVRPVLAIGRGVSETALDRMRQVAGRMVDAGLDDPPLEVYLVNLVGRLDPLDL